MIKIHKDPTTKNKYYAVTDKGVIYGGSPEVVERKISRLKAKEIVYNQVVKGSNDNYKEFDLPF